MPSGAVVRRRGGGVAWRCSLCREGGSPREGEEEVKSEERDRPQH